MYYLLNVVQEYQLECYDYITELQSKVKWKQLIFLPSIPEMLSNPLKSLPSQKAIRLLPAASSSGTAVDQLKIAQE